MQSIYEDKNHSQKESLSEEGLYLGFSTRREAHQGKTYGFVRRRSHYLWRLVQLSLTSVAAFDDHFTRAGFTIVRSETGEMAA